MTMGDELAQAAAEALAEDEALRGDLTDDGFLPVLTWATGLALARADQWRQQPDPRAAMWDGVAQLKDLARGVVHSAEALAPEPLLAVSGPLASAVTDALDQVDWTEDLDENARSIVAAVAPLPWPGAEAASAETEAP
ncbi:MAG: hypothetical protein NTZ05_20875 [Chloroflexi bacterium]|nr:hypothetical protein [Chloroflexota bacterium]